MFDTRATPEVDTLKVPKVYVNTECKLGAHCGVL